jgi:hypothetical protein
LHLSSPEDVNLSCFIIITSRTPTTFGCDGCVQHLAIHPDLELGCELGGFAELPGKIERRTSFDASTLLGFDDVFIGLFESFLKLVACADG